MPPLNWDVFASLPGAVEDNFEMLCRALIRCHYSRYGTFAARAAQPGVEFHLKLDTPSTLGDQDRWYGWQCRWYNLPSGRTIGTTRRSKIEQAIALTERELPSLTDWVLWTRHPLTKGDQEWYYGLETRMKLHLWTALDVQEHLSGDAVIFRDTYFGELVLTPSALRNIHNRSIAPIRQRWLPEVHQTVEAERELRQMLGEIHTWTNLLAVSNSLEVNSITIETGLSELPDPLCELTTELSVNVRALAGTLRDLYTLLNHGDLDLLRQELTNYTVFPIENYASLMRQLKSMRHRFALFVTNMLSDCRMARVILQEISYCLETRLVAVVADAGCGKTQLAAQLTVENGRRPAGVLFHGTDLYSGRNFDNLASSITINGKPPQSMEALVAAINAAGQRAHARLPIVIDGLNEAEDPREWKALLATLDETLRMYPYVMVVCTLRTAFADEALPSGVEQLEIPDFKNDTKEAIRRYLDYYRINYADVMFPLGLLSHPLTLRLFCEVTNPSRDREVGVEAIPGSLTALFDCYLNQAARRIVELAPRTWRYYEQDVRNALLKIATALWEEKSRSLDLVTLRNRLDDARRPWNESIVRALEQEGVLLRDIGDTESTTRITVVYDALAGHLIADSFLTRYGRTGFDEWLRNPETSNELIGLRTEIHPLADDTLRALVGLAPRRLSLQIWPLLDEPLRSEALRGSVFLEAAHLDDQTVQALASLVESPSTGFRDPLARLWQTRGAPEHPLNAEFLDSVLRPLTVANRDVRWTEWLRHNHKDIIEDLTRLEKKWCNNEERFSDDCLRARWVMWTLTSTVKDLRDQATRTLYWFGRGNPADLFDLTIDALTVNDPYVSERLLAASYGVVMAHQMPNSGFSDVLSSYLVKLRDMLTTSTATTPTNHWLARLYVQGTFTLANAFYPGTIPPGIEVNGHVQFASGLVVEPILSDDPRAAEANRTLHIDFENYTLGRLFDDRRNYDMGHTGHQNAIAHVRGTVWALGWRLDDIGKIDQDIGMLPFRSNQPFTERYGKKYGWIGYYTYAGILSDLGQLSTSGERLPDVQIDPSFPESSLPDTINIPNWTDLNLEDDRDWMQQGNVIVPDELLYRSNIGPETGPWIAVNGDLFTKDQSQKRQVFGLLTVLLVAETDVDRLIEALTMRDYPGNWWLPDVPSDHYTFAGEIPWNSRFASNYENDDPKELYKGAIHIDSGSQIEVEILAHRYSWERHHSNLNQAGGALVPSKPFSAEFDLRGIPQSFNQKMPDGTTAAVSLAAPAGFTGNLLYLREDLVYQYADGRSLIWFIWGERQLHYNMKKEPEWLMEAWQRHAGVWRRICAGGELSTLFS